MEQITITREQFREKISKNQKGYGIVRMMREHPEKAKGHEMRLVLEELTTMIILDEIETELFGDEKQQAEEAKPAVQDLPFC